MATGVIWFAADVCSDSFQTALSKMGKKKASERQKRQLLDEERRFKNWVEGSGAGKIGNGSLDHKLKDAEDRLILAQFLLTLGHLLKTLTPESAHICVVSIGTTINTLKYAYPEYKEASDAAEASDQNGEI